MRLSTQKLQMPVLKGKKVFICLFSLLPLFSIGQVKKPQNMPRYDSDIIHFGFILGINSTNFVVKPIKDFHNIDTIFTVEPESSSGFSLGIVSNLRITDNFDLRFVPDLSFCQRDLNFTMENSGQTEPVVIKKTVESTFINFPVDIKFKSNRINNYRMYVLGGFRYSLDLASRKKDKSSKDKQPLRIESSDYGYEIGFGIDFYFAYVKFSPEIKMFNGMKNLLVKDEFAYSNSLEKLYSKIFLFSITFE
jgi:hypothetical protein